MLFQSHYTPQKQPDFTSQSFYLQNIQGNTTFKAIPFANQSNASKFISTQPPNQSKYQQNLSQLMQRQRNIKQFENMMKLINFYNRQAHENNVKIKIKQQKVKFLDEERNYLVNKIEQHRRRYKQKQRSIRHRRCKTQQFQNQKKEGQKLYVNNLRNKIRKLKTQFQINNSSQHHSSRSHQRISEYSSSNVTNKQPLRHQSYQILSKIKDKDHRRQKIRTKIIYIPIMIPSYPNMVPSYDYYNQPSKSRINAHEPMNAFKQSGSDKMMSFSKKSSNSRQMRRSKGSNKSNTSMQNKEKERRQGQNNRKDQIIVALGNELQNIFRKNSKQDYKKEELMNQIGHQLLHNYFAKTQQQQKYKSLPNIQPKILQSKQNTQYQLPKQALTQERSNRNYKFTTKSILLNSIPNQVPQFGMDEQQSKEQQVSQSQIKIIIADSSKFLNNNRPYRQTLEIRESDSSMVKINIQDSFNVNTQEQQEDDDLIYSIRLDTQSKISKVNNSSNRKYANLLQLPKEQRYVLSSITERSEDKDYSSKNQYQNQISKSQPKYFEEFKDKEGAIQQSEIATLIQGQNDDDQDMLLLSNLRASTTKNIIKGSKMYHRPKSTNLLLATNSTIIKKNS